MIKQGSIISIGGMTSHRGSLERSHLMATKSGLGGLMRGMAIDLGKFSIRSNAVMVGAFDTTRKGGSSPVTAVDPSLQIPLGRKGLPQDLANLIQFLVGPGAEYISGQTIHCNGAAYCPM